MTLLVSTTQIMVHKRGGLQSRPAAAEYGVVALGNDACPSINE